MAHAHLSNLNLKYLKFFQLLPGNCGTYLHFKKCLFLWSGYKAHEMKLPKHEGHTEKAASRVRHRTALEGDALPAGRTLLVSFQQALRVLSRQPRDRPITVSSSFTGQGANAEVKDTHMNFYTALTV